MFRYQKNRDITKDTTESQNKLITDIGDLRQKVVSIEQGLKFIEKDIARIDGGNLNAWKIIELYAGRALHQDDDRYGIDFYIDKNEEEGLSKDEAYEFSKRLKIVIDHPKNRDQKAIATMMLAAITYRYKLEPHKK